MSIKTINEGIRKGRELSFTWWIKKYDINKKYKGQYVTDNDCIKLLVEPIYKNANIVESKVFILFDTIKGHEAEKEFRFFVRTVSSDRLFIVSNLHFAKLCLKERIATYPCIFQPHNYKSCLNRHNDLKLKFEILIVDVENLPKTNFEPEKYSMDFQNFFHNKTFYDCEFVVEGNTITANKQIIAARCEVLLNALDQNGNRLVIDGHSVKGFYQFLRYIYCEQIDIENDDIITDVLSLAHKYQMNGLKDLCDNILYKSLNLENANAIYQNAYKYQLSKNLLDKSYSYVQELFKNVNQSLPDEFIDDPMYVDNLISIVENLINGLKKKISFNISNACDTDSTNQLKIQNAIDNIYKETADILNNENIDIISKTFDTNDEAIDDRYNDELTQSQFVDDVFIEDIKICDAGSCDDTYAINEREPIYFDDYETKPYYMLDSIPEEDSCASSVSDASNAAVTVVKCDEKMSKFIDDLEEMDYEITIMNMFCLNELEKTTKNEKQSD